MFRLLSLGLRSLAYFFSQPCVLWYHSSLSFLPQLELFPYCGYKFKIGHALTLTQGNKLQILDFSSLIKLANEYFKKLAHYSYSNFHIDKTYKVNIMTTLDCVCAFLKKNFYKVNCLLRCLLGVTCLEQKQTTGQFKIIQENNKINLCCSKLYFQEWYGASVFH